MKVFFFLSLWVTELLNHYSTMKILVADWVFVMKTPSTPLAEKIMTSSINTGLPKGGGRVGSLYAVRLMDRENWVTGKGQETSGGHVGNGNVEIRSPRKEDVNIFNHQLVLCVIPLSFVWPKQLWWKVVQGPLSSGATMGLWFWAAINSCEVPSWSQVQFCKSFMIHVVNSLTFTCQH